MEGMEGNILDIGICNIGKEEHAKDKTVTTIDVPKRPGKPSSPPWRDQPLNNTGKSYGGQNSLNPPCRGQNGANLDGLITHINKQWGNKDKIVGLRQWLIDSFNYYQVGGVDIGVILDDSWGYIASEPRLHGRFLALTTEDRERLLLIIARELWQRRYGGY